jgi:outer membrane protein assembly factor BamB
VTLTVLRSGVDTTPSITVDLSYVDGTATSVPFGDYEPLNAVETVAFPPGVTSVDVRVPVRPDFDDAEGDEFFTAVLSNFVIVAPGSIARLTPRLASAPYDTTVVTITDAPVAGQYYNSSWPRAMRDARSSGSASTIVRRCPPFALPFTVAAYAAPAIGENGTIYLGDDAGVLHALDQCAGVTLWTHTIGGTITASPSIAADGTVYAGSLNFQFHAVNGGDGSLRWSHTAAGEFRGEAAIGINGIVFVGSAELSV